MSKIPRDEHPFRFNEQRNNPDLETIVSIYDEITWLYGTDLKYISRELANTEQVFGEFLSMILREAKDIRLFVQQVEQFEGAGPMYTKFGLTLQDEMTCYGPKILFESKGILPKPDDIILHVPSNRLFEVAHVYDEKNEAAFYPLGENIAYRLQCSVYQHDYSEIHPDVIEDIPDIAALDEANPLDLEVNNEEYKGEAASHIDDTEKDPLMR